MNTLLSRIESGIHASVTDLAYHPRETETMTVEQIAILTMLGTITLCALLLATFCLTVWMRLRDVNLPKLSTQIGALVEIERQHATHEEPYMPGV